MKIRGCLFYNIYVIILRNFTEEVQKMDRKKIINALRRESPLISEAECEKRADRILRETDERFTVNVEEWADSRPFSDVRAGKYSISLIMGIREDNSFYPAWEAIHNAVRDPENADMYVWRFKL